MFLLRGHNLLLGLKLSRTTNLKQTLHLIRILDLFIKILSRVVCYIFFSGPNNSENMVSLQTGNSIRVKYNQVTVPSHVSVPMSVSDSMSQQMSGRHFRAIAKSVLGYMILCVYRCLCLCRYKQTDRQIDR